VNGVDWVNFLGHESEATFSNEIFEWHWILTHNDLHQDIYPLVIKHGWEIPELNRWFHGRIIEQKVFFPANHVDS